MSAEGQPRAEDIAAVREHVLVMNRVYERALVGAQELGDEEGALAVRRRRNLVGEMLEWLEARQDLSAAAAAPAGCAQLLGPLPPGGWIG